MYLESLPTWANQPDEAHQAMPVSPAPRNARVRILLVDDHLLFGHGLRLLLGGDEAFEVVEQAHSGSQAVTLARLCDPDLVLLDIELPDANGLDIVAQLRRVCPGARIAVLTGHHEQEHLMRALQLGVQGFLHKDMPVPALLAGLHELAEGERVIGKPEALTTALAEFGRLLQERERARSGLTDQEVEILRLAAVGLNNKEIGVRQFWSEITVKRKMQDIYRKLRVKSRAQAVAEAIRLGFI